MSKAVSYKVDGSQLIVSVDPDGNGVAVIEVKLSLIELLSEVGHLFVKKAE